MLLTIFALVVLATTMVWFLLTLVLRRAMPRGADAPAMERPWPRVSIVVAAMNEEQEIEGAVRSMLALDYPALEVVAVNDRSTDRTGEILDALAREQPERLRVVHVRELPAGWLGKCNALEQGEKLATGEWLLFTDADVLFEPQALRTAVAWAEMRAADHLIFFPEMLWHEYTEAALLSFFTMSLSISFRLWAIESRSMRAFMGVGAFNLVRRSLYDRFGGHRTLRMEVADDMKLGYLAKKFGGRSMAVRSEGEVRVRWRNGTRDTIRGLERSGFPGIDFSMTVAIGSVVGCLAGLLAPLYLPLVAGSAVVTAICAAAALFILAAYAVDASTHRLPLWIGILHPVACILFAYAMIRSVVVTLRAGGLSWRGTFYSIAELRRGTVR